MSKTQILKKLNQARWLLDGAITSYARAEDDLGHVELRLAVDDIIDVLSDVKTIKGGN